MVIEQEEEEAEDSEQYKEEALPKGLRNIDELTPEYVSIYLHLPHDERIT